MNSSGIILPPLRKGISIAFDDYDVDGKPQWLIHDAGRNKFFIIGWQEFEILSRWHLRDPLLIIESINAETTLHVEMPDVENVLKFLSNHYLIQQSAQQIIRNAEEQKLFKNDNLIHWLISNYLYFRIPLCRPDHFLNRTKIVANIIFHRYTAFVMLALAIIALAQLGGRWDYFTHSFSSIFTLQGFFFYLVAFLTCKLCHELGHAYMCKRYGIPVPTLGVAFLVFWPVLYTDTTQSWKLGYKQRMRIALAGMWIETYVTIIAALIWCNTSNLILQSICYVTISVNWFASVLINVSPFMRFDGYYVLADYMKMPNLQPRAFAYTRWAIRRLLFGWDEPPPETFSKRMRYFLIIYSLTTWVYRLSLYIGIAVLVYHFFIKILGIILFGIELFYFILGPIVAEVRYWIYSKDRFELNINTKITLICSILAVLFFFLPINDSVKLPGTLSYAHQFLYAFEPGILVTELPPTGTHFEKDAIIAVIRSPDLENEMRKVMLEYNKTEDELRRATVAKEYADKIAILMSDINKQKAEYQRLQDEREQLTIKAPFSGKLIEVDTGIRPGTTLQKGQWLGDMINPNDATVEAFVDQVDRNSIAQNAEGYFYPDSISISRIKVKVITIEALNAQALSCAYSQELNNEQQEERVIATPCYNASDVGGGVPTVVAEDGSYIPANSVYRVMLATPDHLKIPFIVRGTVILTSAPHSYAYRLFYHIKSIWIEQNSF